MTDKDWKRLADAVRQRRDELGMTQEEVAAAGGPSTATMRLLEGALGTSYRSRTFTQLERALAWTRGTVRHVLDGGDPLLSASAQHVRGSRGLPPADEDVESKIARADVFTDAEKESLLEALRLRRAVHGVISDDTPGARAHAADG